MNKILIVLVVVLAATVGYFAFVKKDSQVAQQPTPTPTPTKTVQAMATPKDETANWKVYTNSEFGYSFKYPSNYTVKEYGTDVQIYEPSVQTPNYVVDFYGQKSDAALSSIIKEKTGGRVLSEARPITVNGLSGYEGVDQGMISWYAIFVKNDSSLVEIKFGSTDKGGLQQDRAALTSTQKLILSTFKFTN